MKGHKKPELEVLFSNSNSLSEKAEAFLSGDCADLWLAAETHARDAKLQGAVDRLKKKGWQCAYAEARQSDKSESGTQGGILGAAKDHLSVQHMAGDERRGAAWRSTHRDLVGLNVALRGGDIIVLGGYARNSAYLTLLRQVALATGHGRSPFILLADFNVPPDVLEQDEALAALDAVVMRPEGGSISCHQGAGTLIDYIIVSRAAVPLVQVRLDRKVPWGPHDALRLRIKRCVG